MASTGHLTPSSPPWDVFLSFRGSDTRWTFTGHLYQALDRTGIRTFMDDRELHGGEVISDALPQAIKDSKTYIVVLSENYASSRWCLDELVQILDCYKKMDRLVIPVFFKINPADVRHQIGSFGSVFGKHQSRFDGEKLKKWCVTLTEVADFSGKEISAGRYEADIINEIVDEILLNIKPKSLYVVENPVGLDVRVNYITNLLSSGTEGVIRIGFYGMPGVGKSTLAKAVYNQLLQGGTFKGSCFLAEVGEASRRANGLVLLQQQLLDDVLGSKKRVEVHNDEQGMMFIRARICSAKVLVLVDDIDNHKQYKSLVGPFASGSVVIVTTKNEEILDKIEVEAKYRYQVQVLDKAESLALFTQHAFGNAKPDKTLQVLFEDILSLAGGLPIALEVFGAYLYNKPEVGWKSYITNLKRNPDNTIQEKLVISLKALKSNDPMLEKLFLDIACFFIGREKHEVVDILATYYSYVDHKIDILKKRCLLTIDDSDKLRMHELLRGMGRKVAQNNSLEEPGDYSRLWVSKDICDVLEKRKGTKAIEGIIPSNFYYQNAFEGVSYSTATFKRMSILRFLYIEDVELRGSFEHIFENLRWLRWDGCPLKCLPSDFCPEKLVILALRRSKIRRMWKLNMDSQVFRKLKTLDMSYSLDLTTTPDFTILPCLETLNLKGCKSLEGVHKSIGLLVSLSYLNMKSCINLRSLPEDICNLRALKRLNIGGCSSLKALPLKLGHINSLTELNAWGLATVSSIPDSIIHLDNLHELNLSDHEYGTPSTTIWDVFLSYHGSDTRYRFPGDLCYTLDCNGVTTFMYDPEMRGDEAMPNGLRRAIRQAKAYIVVFSESYAFSSCCLEELTEILKSHKTTGRSIIAVYYCIKPSVESFEKAFMKHETHSKNNIEKVNEWRRTLSEVVGFSGFFVSDSDRSSTSMSDIIKAIVNKVLQELDFRRYDVARYPVGLDCRVGAVTRLSSSDTTGVIKIGLYGMGGVGKSTLARALYNQLSLSSFKGKCFLTNVREASRTTKGLLSLQQQLITDVLGTKKVKVANVDQGTKMIQSIICLAKVLVVIDDVDDHKQFTSLVGPFAPGSVVIITTRYEDILDKIQVDPRNRYMVDVLDEAESLELFTKHAFENGKPDNTLLELSNDILGHARGLPLALVTFGSHLHMRSPVAWKDFIEKLQLGAYRV